MFKVLKVLSLPEEVNRLYSLENLSAFRFYEAHVQSFGMNPISPAPLGTWGSHSSPFLAFPLLYFLSTSKAAPFLTTKVSFYNFKH